MLHNNWQNQNPNAKSLTLLIEMRKYFKALFQQNIFWMMYLISVHFQCCMFTPFVYHVVLNTDNQTIKLLRLVRVYCNLSTFLFTIHVIFGVFFKTVQLQVKGTHIQNFNNLKWKLRREIRLRNSVGHMPLRI